MAGSTRSGDERAALESLQRAVWKGSVPVEIRLAAEESRSFDAGETYLVSECVVRRQREESRLC